MDEIRNQVARARRRLMLASFVRVLTQSWLVLFSIAVVGLLIPKIWYVPIEPSHWQFSWLGGTAAIGVLAAWVTAWLSRPSSIAAAVEVDRRLMLRERLSSALQLDQATRETACGQALLEDAAKTADRIDVREAFALRLKLQQLWSFLPILVAASTLLIPNALPPKATGSDLDQAALTQVKNTAKDLLEQVRKQRAQAEADDLEDSAIDFFKQLESKLDDLHKTKSQDPKKILSDINQLKDALKQRRDALGSPESIRKNLAGMKSMDPGPAEKMAESIRDADFEKAVDELDKLMRELESGSMSKASQEQLAKQLDQMAKALEQMTADHQEMIRDLEKQIREAENAGDVEKVASLREKMAEAQAQAEAMEDIQSMSSELRSAQEALQQGDPQAARKALDKMQKTLEKMNQADKQLQDIKALMEGTEQCKNCAQGQCEGGNGKGDQESPQWSQGKGEGRGSGPRDEKETDTRFIESQVRTEMQQGETVYGGKAGGVNRKGVSREEMKQAVQSSEIEDPEAIDSLPLPKKQLNQAREYYDSLRQSK